MTKSTVKLTKVEPGPSLTHVVYILDRSGSMQMIREATVRAFNDQVELASKPVYNTTPDVSQAVMPVAMSLVTFSSLVDEPVAWAVPPKEFGRLDSKDYLPGGNTALRDAIGITLARLKDADVVASTPKPSYLLVVITDGEENYSRIYSTESLRRLIADVNSTDRYTITCSVPGIANTRFFTDLGIPVGNIQKWEATNEGVERLVHERINPSYGFYMSSRAVGATSTRDFFQPDVSNLTARGVQQALDEVTRDFKALEVKKPSRVDEFIRKQGFNYTPGSAFYQLTKKEKVQGYKEFILRDQRGRVFKGNDSARRLLGLPVGGSIELYPAQTSDYVIFVQSTSLNRKLLPGTEVLYRVR